MLRCPTPRPADAARLAREDLLMLTLRPNCECCDRDLPADSADARICSFECTFCASCADGVLAGRCPNCGDQLVRRAIRPPVALATNPASTDRTVKAVGCIPVGQTDGGFDGRRPNP